MSTEVIPYEQRIGALTVQDVQSQVNLIQHVMRQVMKKDEHYGVIPGTGTKPTLLKAGAEKLCLTFRLDPQYESTERYDGVHLTVKSKCTLFHIPSGQRFGSGEGSCSTRESKYAYRTGSRKCPNCGAEAIIKGKDFKGDGLPTGWICFGKKGGCGAKFLDGDKAIEGQTIGRIQNEDVADQYNTVLKMANKRSLVAAVLNATAASDIFTQDIEDMPQFAAQPVVDAQIVEVPKGERDKELTALCKQAGISPKFYLNRADVKTASELSDDDWTEVVAAVKRKIKAAQDKEELSREPQI
jgi:hypothetical protein